VLYSILREEQLGVEDCIMETLKAICERRSIRDYKKEEIPREVISDIPKITVTGFDEILIENFKGILEYEDFFARISTEIGNININGFNLKLNQMTDNDILVSGKIENIDFENGK